MGVMVGATREKTELELQTRPWVQEDLYVKAKHPPSYSCRFSYVVCAHSKVILTSLGGGVEDKPQTRQSKPQKDAEDLPKLTIQMTRT